VQLPGHHTNKPGFGNLAIKLRISAIVDGQVTAQLKGFYRLSAAAAAAAAAAAPECARLANS
jgi:hypothetical protein